MDENKINNNMTSPEDDAQKKENTGYTVTPEGGFFSDAPDDSSEKDASLSEENSASTEEKSSFVLSDSDKKEEDTVRHAPSVAPYDSYKSYSSCEPKPKKQSKGVSVAVVILAIVLSAIIGATGGIFGMLAIQQVTDNKGSSFTENSQATGDGNSVNINVEEVTATVGEAVAEKVTPSVVGIRTTISVTSFFGGTQEATGEGSGVIYTSDGYIITNYHVIGDAIEYGQKDSAIQVFLSTDTEKGYDATVVGYNISNDLAVVKINGKNLPAIEWADSSTLKVGQQVMAVGNPGGLEFMGSATWGIVSGLNRIVSDSSDGSATQLIQTDAAINPGNSGGALVNIEGQLVGINSSKLVSESVEGMGFAIPSNTVKDICDKIIAKEYDPDPYLGITISERYDPDTLKRYGFPVGAVIYSVDKGGPAAEAGLRQGDIITKFNGKSITHYNKLSQYLSECKTGSEVDISIYRNGRNLDGKIKIGSNNSQ